MRRAGLAVAASVILLLAPGASAAAKPAAMAAAAHDWSKTVAVTPSGGFRMGNPRAKVAIVEYGSLTCPHCRHFAETAMKPLSQYVRDGKASYEFRSYVLNQVDLAATLVARCGGPAHFFAIAEQLYATQPEWSEKLGDLPRDEQDRIDALAEPQMILAIGKVSGLMPIAAAHGIPPAKAEACLKDERAATGLMKDVQAAGMLGITGTPTIFINGKRAPVYDWESLAPYLKGSAG